MKQLNVLLLAFLVSFTFTAIAQKKEKPNTKVFEKRAERMASELGLTDADKNRVQVLFEQQEADYKTAKEKLNPSDANYKTKLEELHKKQESDLEKMLGKEKMAKYKEKRKQDILRLEAVKMKNQPTGTTN